MAFEWWENILGFDYLSMSVCRALAAQNGPIFRLVFRPRPVWYPLMQVGESATHVETQSDDRKVLAVAWANQLRELAFRPELCITILVCNKSSSLLNTTHYVAPLLPQLTIEA